MPGKSAKNGRTGIATFLALAIGLAVTAFGGIALANVTTGGGAGLDVLSAGSAPEPPKEEPKPPAEPPRDTTPPAFASVKGNKLVTVRGRARFNFAATEAGITFKCRVDAREFEPCTSPFAAPRLRAGHHTFTVQAFDAAGNPSAVTEVGFRVKKPAVHKRRHHHRSPQHR